MRRGVQKKSCRKRVLSPKEILPPKKILGPKKILSPKKILGPKKFLGPKKILGPKIFLGLKRNLGQIASMDKFCQDISCLDKCHPDSSQEPTFKVWSKLSQ